MRSDVIKCGYIQFSVIGTSDNIMTEQWFVYMKQRFLYITKCPTHSREMFDKFESQHPLTPSIWSDIVGAFRVFGRTWEWIFKDFFLHFSRWACQTLCICKRTFFPVCRMSSYVNTLVYFYLAPYSR